MLEVKKLTKVYGKNKSVSDLTFSVDDHETVGLLGPNGAGKSTTMRMLTGYISPTAGSISIMGKNMLEEPLEARKYIGYLPELPPLYLDMTVSEHLSVVCSLRGIKKNKVSAEVERVCNHLNISDVAGRVVKNLSKGYKQRVGFAAALIGDPKLLILDEPTVGLDPCQIIEIRNLIQELSSKMSIIISSHMLTEISSVCSRIIIMNKGHMVADGSPKEIEQQYCDQSRTEVVVKGSREASQRVLKACLGDRARFSMDDGEANDQIRYVVTAPQGIDLREEIFRAFARDSGELSILSLRSLNLTLEEIFINIIQ